MKVLGKLYQFQRTLLQLYIKSKVTEPGHSICKPANKLKQIGFDLHLTQFIAIETFEYN